MDEIEKGIYDYLRHQENGISALSQEEIRIFAEEIGKKIVEILIESGLLGQR